MLVRTERSPPLVNWEPGWQSTSTTTKGKTKSSALNPRFYNPGRAAITGPRKGLAKTPFFFSFPFFFLDVLAAEK